MGKQLRGVIVDCVGVNFIVPASKHPVDQLAIIIFIMEEEL